MFTPELNELAHRIADVLKARNETIGVAEGSAGGLISATLLSVAGASAYFRGGAVIYTMQAGRAFLAESLPPPPGLRGATEEFATYLASAVALRLGTTWGLAEAGAAGPPNRYGDPSGHAWFAVAGTENRARNLLTGSDDRVENMVSFAVGALTLLRDALTEAPK